MRLIDTRSLEFGEFFDSNYPKYAILSHRWEGQEVSLQDFHERKDKAYVGSADVSFLKISRCCSMARRRGFDWVWIDTCCIDKKSSAELSEAINSMFKWYRNAKECYVYLSDVYWTSVEKYDLAYSASQLSLSLSRWFTRGWTLQELLAPFVVYFFDEQWSFIGTKLDLSHEISRITGISSKYIQRSPVGIATASVAEKMSWISKRETSRVEDLAYCMLGLFDVNMPLLYGEGRKAFIRLQLEIIKTSDDESIFAWDDRTIAYSGLLAPWPDCFRQSQGITTYDMSLRTNGRKPFTMTNKGLELAVPKCNFNYHPSTTSFLINCHREQPNLESQVPFTLYLGLYREGWLRMGNMEELFDDERDIRQETIAESRTVHVPQVIVRESF